MSAFYPTKKKGRFEKKGEKPNWCPDDGKTISGMFVGGKFSKKVFEFLRYAKINAYTEAPLAEEAKGKKIPVMIFSHGIRGHRNFCSGVCREFASQGFAVFSVEHNDGTAAYHYNEENKQGKEYREEDMEDMNIWEPRLEQRKREV